MKIGIFTVSAPEYTPEEMIRIAKELGYDGLEWRIVNDPGDRSNPSFWSGNRTSMSIETLAEKAGDLKKLGAEAGIEFPSLGTYMQSSDAENFEGAMKAAVALGAKSLRIGPGAFDPARPFWMQFAEARTRYGKIEALAKKYNVRAVVETHMGQLCPSVALATRLLDGMDPKHTGIMWDPGNQTVEGLEDYTMAVAMAGEYLAEVHVKNSDRVPFNLNNGTLEWNSRTVPLSIGFVNWPQVLAVLKKAQYNGWLILEDFSNNVPLKERLDYNQRYLREILNRI